MVKFRDAEISDAEASVLRELENGQNWQFNYDVKYGDKTGKCSFATHNNHIYGLCCHMADLKIIPESIGELRWLYVLELYGNQLSQLPESIGNLKLLRNLELGSNNLKMMPKSIFHI